MRSAGVRCSTPHARAGNGWPKIAASLTRPQSVHTMPSNP